MTYWKLTLAYDGTPFHGWQVQPGLATVQGLLADAIHRTVGERILPQGSGRTDTGVHALAQVASFALAAPIPAANLHNALNRCLPPSVRILSAEPVAPAFHARHSARAKTYEYRIFPLKPPPPESSATHPNQPAPHSSRSHRDESIPPSNPTLATHPHNLICPPILAPYVWPCPWPLDLAALNRAASQVLGAHDFTSFAASDPDLATRTNSPAQPASISADSSAACGNASSHPSGEDRSPCGMPSPTPPTNIRTITQSRWHASNDLLIYRVTATGFLHHMVRNLVGTFVQCGAHRLSPNDIPTILAARNRSAAGPTAPPTGLFLHHVEYDDNAPPTLI